MLISALHWLKIFEVLDPEQKVLDGFEDQFEEEEVLDTDWDNVDASNIKPIEMEEVQESKAKPIGGVNPAPKSQKKKSSSHKLAKLAGANKDFVSFLTTYHIANKTEKKILLKYLDSKVEAEGKNFEESQRKVIITAKELFKQPDILFMEEGHIDVPDLEDKYFFDAIFDNMKNSTIVTVLSGFDYLASFDVIYWMKDGKVVERGSPKTLLDKDNSILATECKKSSKKMYKFLMAAVGINRPKVTKNFLTILESCDSDL